MHIIVNISILPLKVHIQSVPREEDCSIEHMCHQLKQVKISKNVTHGLRSNSYFAGETIKQMNIMAKYILISLLNSEYYNIQLNWIQLNALSISFLNVQPRTYLEKKYNFDINASTIWYISSLHFLFGSVFPKRI